MKNAESFAKVRMPPSEKERVKVIAPDVSPLYAIIVDTVP